jgi:hypothetical protein
LKARYAQCVLRCEQLVDAVKVGMMGPAQPTLLIETHGKVCYHCDAWLFEGETENLCCRKGKVDLPRFPEAPPRLRQLLMEDTVDGRVFRKHTRLMNQALSLASLTVKHARPAWAGGYNPNVVISGRSYFNIGSLQPAPGVEPRNAQVRIVSRLTFTLKSGWQVWVHDPGLEDEAFNVRAGHLHQFMPISTSQQDKARLLRILRELQTELARVNPYVRLFKHLAEVQHDVSPLQLSLTEKDLPENSTRRYTAHHSPEVAVLVEDEPGKRDIVIRMRGGGIQRITDIHRAADPLFFILMHPHGNPGYRLGLTRTLASGGTQRMSATKFYCFHLHQRTEEGEAHLRLGRVFQEWCCLMYAKVENQVLEYQRHNQAKLRSDLYNNVMDSVNRDDSGNVGKRVVLSNSVVGSPRYMAARFQDSMAVVRRFGKPDLFITMTCNPTWPEITAALLTGQTAHDRPDLVARVFKLKLKVFLNELLKAGVFGKTVAHFQVIEFQKRGLPHAHILIILEKDDKLRTPADVDNCIVAELPPSPDIFADPEQRAQATRLMEIVTTNMVHGPCGEEKPDAPCMFNNRGECGDICQKNYPMDYNLNTL